MSTHIVLTQTSRRAGCPVGVASITKFTQHRCPVAKMVPDVTLECADSAVDAWLRAETQPTVLWGVESRTRHSYMQNIELRLCRSQKIKAVYNVYDKMIKK